MSQPTLLIVEDDEDIRTQMKWALAAEYDVAVAWDQTSAHEAFTARRPVVTLLDLGLPPRPNDPDVGMATLGSLLAIDPAAKIIIVSGQAERQNALRAVGAGAYDFLTKPVDMDELRLVLQRCVYVAELEHEYRALQQSRRVESFEGMIGVSPKMQAVFTFVRKVAPTTAPVLILGESGTGKEMVAQALHRRSAGRSTGRSSPSTATPSPRTCSRASCSATRRARSRARTRSARGTSRPPPAARSSSMRSAICRRPSRSSCCATCRRSASSASAAARRWPAMRGSSPPPI
jgi:CheY-like chemotaxis protein